MPGLDYKRDVRLSGANARALHELFGHPRFYDGTPGRTLVPCPDCSLPADEKFGDHGGTCRRHHLRRSLCAPATEGGTPDGG